MLYTITLALATFWAWETVRYAATEYAQAAYSATRVVHPLVVAALPLAVLWPDWVRALAVAGLVGILHSLMSWVAGPDPQPVVTSRERRRPTLPGLPG